MKKFVSILLVLVLVLSMTGCKKSKEEPKTDAAPTKAAQTASQKNTADDEKNKQVTVKVPNSIFGEITNESLAETVASKGYVSGSYDEESQTATIVMTAGQRDEYLAEIAKYIRDNVAEAKNDETYGANVDAINIDDDFKVYSITLKDPKIGWNEYMILFALATYASGYNMVAGRSEDETVRVDFIDAATGQVFTSTTDDDFSEYVDLSDAEFDFGDGTRNITFTESDLTDYTLFDNDKFAFRIDSIETNGDWGYTINVTSINKTDKYVSFSLSNESINDWTISSYFGSQIDGKGESQDSISYNDSDIADAGITDPTRISFNLSIYDMDDWENDKPMFSQDFVIYPLGEENDVDYLYALEDDDITIVNDKNVAMYLVDTNPEDMWGYGIKLLIINKSDIKLSVYSEDMTVNDWSVSNYFSTDVAPRKMAMCSMSFDQSALERFGVDTPDKIAFMPVIKDYDHWDSDNLYKGGKFEFYPDGKSAYSFKKWEAPASVAASDKADKYTVIIPEITVDEYWGDYKMNVYVENRYDKQISINFGNAYINGDYEYEYGLPSFSIPAGGRVLDEISLSSDVLGAAGISSLDSLKLGFKIYDDSDEWSDIPIAENELTVKCK